MYYDIKTKDNDDYTAEGALKKMWYNSEKIGNKDIDGNFIHQE